jgi:hypothetical protein
MKRICAIAALALSALLVMASAAFASQTPSVNFANAPSGTHFASGSASPTCSVTSSQVTCPSTTFVLGGVGHTNATETLNATYTATVDCRNNGGQVVATKTEDFTAPTASTPLHPSRNGQLSVTPLIVNAPTAAQFEAQATCPNPNWTPEVRGPTITLASFSYALTFDGFSSPAITIVGNDP